MELSSSVIKQFVEVVSVPAGSNGGDNTAYGEIVEVNGGTYAKIDGSSTVTPVATTARVKVGDRVVITLKNHTATVIGNTTDPSASNAQVTEIEGNVTRFETVIADKVSVGELDAQIARIVELEAEYATIDTLVAKDAEIDRLLAKTITAEEVAARYASIETLEANYATIYQLDAKYATIDNLTAANAKINGLEANFATISDLYATKAEIDSLNSAYAEIDFANIGQAAFEKIYSEYGLIEDLVLKDGTLTGKLAAVTIDGDRINANTLKADRLIVKGTDGLYYQLNANTAGVTQAQLATDEYQNALHGSNIIAKTLTADKLSVTDLVAFGATIGGLKIADGSIYSGVKTSADNTNSGFYLDKNGQMAVGNASNYIKYHNNKLEISAEKLILSASNKSVETLIDETVENIDVGARNLLENSSFYYDHSGWSVYEGSVEHVTKYGKECAHISHTALNTYTYIGQDVLHKLEPDTEYIFSGNVLAENIIAGTTNHLLHMYTGGWYDESGTSTWFDIGNVSIPANAGLGSWVRIKGTLRTDSTKLAAATRFQVYVSARDFTGDLYFSELKLEKGNKATDWTAAPEDAARQSDMLAVQTSSEDLTGRMALAESTILQLKESISMLVQDENGMSLMTQTADGWVFNTVNIQNGVNAVAEGLTTLAETVGDNEITVEKLNAAVDELSDLAPYVKIITYEDEPCIELGEGESDFKLLITNTRILFKEGSSTPAYITNKSLYIDTAVIQTELKLGNFTWKLRSNGNLGLIYGG